MPKNTKKNSLLDVGYYIIPESGKLSNSSKYGKVCGSLMVQGAGVEDPKLVPANLAAVADKMLAKLKRVLAMHECGNNGMYNGEAILSRSVADELRRLIAEAETGMPKPLQCSCPEHFGPHGGKQYRSPHYFACGCDAGYCENHAEPMPFGPIFEIGEPRKCKTCQAKAEGKEVR